MKFQAIALLGLFLAILVFSISTYASEDKNQTAKVKNLSVKVNQ